MLLNIKNILTSLLLIITISASSQVVELKHTYYTNFYDTVKKAPIYSTYLLTKAHLIETVQRSPRFFEDSLLPNRLQGTNKTYLDNGKFDKGHVSPDADFRFNEVAEHEIMYYTNVAPQVSSFNEQTWRAVETYVRKVCQQYDSVYVWTGCLYGSDNLKGIAIPIDYWKVIKYNGDVYESWLGPNVVDTNTDENSIKDSLDDIKKLTGLNFK